MPKSHEYDCVFPNGKNFVFIKVHESNLLLLVVKLLGLLSQNQLVMSRVTYVFYILYEIFSNF